VYSEATDPGLLRRELDRLIVKPKFLVVYCRPPERTLMDFSTHKIKSYDTEQSLTNIVENQFTYIRRYDALMDSIPHVMFDWTSYRDYEMSDMDAFVRMLIDTQYSDKDWAEVINLCLPNKVTSY
jgi:hypothetical protein